MGGGVWGVVGGGTISHSGERYVMGEAHSRDWGVVGEKRGIAIIYILFILIEKL